MRAVARVDFSYTVHGWLDLIYYVVHVTICVRAHTRARHHMRAANKVESRSPRGAGGRVLTWTRTRVSTMARTWDTTLRNQERGVGRRSCGLRGAAPHRSNWRSNWGRRVATESCARRGTCKGMSAQGPGMNARRTTAPTIRPSRHTAEMSSRANMGGGRADEA